MTVSRDAAWQLLTEWTQSESLRKHALAVEAAVRGYAAPAGRQRRGVGRRGAAPRLRLRALSDARRPPEQGLRAPAVARLSRVGDAGHPVARLARSPASSPRRRSRRRWWRATRWPASSPPPRWCGRARACSTSRPASVIKRMKDKAFARAVPRDHLKRGAELMGLPLDQHVTNVIGFMRLRGRRPGTSGNAVTPRARARTYWLIQQPQLVHAGGPPFSRHDAA